jgi:hypothetical protein
MKKINRIAFYLNHSRDIAMFANTFTKINSNIVTFLFNDLYKGYDLNIKEFNRIKKLIAKDFPDYNNLIRISKIYRKYKFNLLISAGNLPISKLTLKSLIKFFLKFFFKNFSVYENKFVEKEISNKVIWYPNNLDRNIKHFPIKKWKNVFDIYLTSSKIEKFLIKKKFPSKKVYNIGFPKLDNKNSKILCKKKIINEFKLNSKKKIIVYLPTLSEQKKSIVKDYISELKNISLHFNLIVRPHPKEKDLNKDKFNLLKRSKLKLDLHDGRDTSQLISAADLIITDGGSSLLESIYLKKRTLIHNWQNKVDLKTIEDRLKNKSRLDVIIIKGMPKKENLNDINYIKKALNDKLLINKIKKLRAKYFIVKDKVLAENIIKKNFLI